MLSLLHTLDHILLLPLLTPVYAHRFFAEPIAQRGLAEPAQPVLAETTVIAIAADALPLPTLVP